MKIYADTGLLCSLYAPDAHTALAITRVGRTKEALPLIWLHQVELRNALRLRVFRREITAAQREVSMNAFLADTAAGVYKATGVEVGDVALECERLGASFTETLGVRSLDLLHVAAALVLGAREFWTFDKRQAALARAAGLRVR